MNEKILKLELVSEVGVCEDYICNLTKDLDGCLTKGYKDMIDEGYSSGTYLIKHSLEGWWCIRFPGATRGGLKVNKNNIIVYIKIYEDTGYNPLEQTSLHCYNQKALEIEERYIGYKLIKKMV